MKAPFTYGTLAIGKAFTDREDETKYLKNNFLSNINTILISPRRWGKSSLVNHVAKQLKNEKEIKFCFIDLYNIRTTNEFYEIYIRELIKASSSKWEEQLRQARTFFKTLIPKFSFSPEPNSEISVSLNWEEVQKHPDEILNLPESIFQKNQIRIIVCIDEFQNINYFENPLSFQKKLRSHWQKHQNTTYCLYGSKRHLLAEVFNHSSMPFYKFGEILFLDKIPLKYWLKFIPERFSSTGKAISESLAQQIAESMELHPYFVQQYAHACWNLTNKTCTEKILDNALENLLDQYTILFQREVDQITNIQLNYLEAISAGVLAIGSQDSLKKYKLKSTSHVARTKEALEKKEIIDTMSKELFIIDPLFKQWLIIRFFGAK